MTLQVRDGANNLKSLATGSGDGVNTPLVSPVGVAVGNQTDAPAGNDTGTFSLLALVKRALQNWATLLLRIPDLGQTTGSGSIPVVLPSDQAPVAVSLPGSVAASAAASTSVGASAGQILAANSARKEVCIVNTGTTTLYLALGVGNPTTTVYHLALQACVIAHDGTGGSWVSDLWTGAVQAIGSGAGGSCAVTEIT